MSDILEVAYSKVVGKSTPGPYVEIVLRSGESESDPFVGLVDSGAAISWVPKKYIQQVEPLPSEKTLLISTPIVEIRRLRPYIVDILIQKNREHWWAIHPIRGVLAGDDDIAYIGRDVLDSFIVTLDGETCQLLPKGEL